MKKIMFTAAVIFSAMFVLQTQTQTQARVGAKLQANLTDVRLTELQRSGKFHEGASLGGFVQIRWNDRFSLQPELLFHYTETKIGSSPEKLRFKYGAVEIPVYAVGMFPAGNGHFFLGAGPHIGYGFSIDARTEEIPSGEPGHNRLESDHGYMGGGATAGYRFRHRISLQAGYQLGWDFGAHRSGASTQTISLGVGYTF